jgi:hypothetical protein
MLARFRLLLPYTLSIRQGDSLTSEEFEQQGYRFRIYSPYQASTNILALADPRTVPSDIVYGLRPAEPVFVDQGVIIDGLPTIPANAIQIDISKTEFERAQGSDDPPIETLFELVNSLLHRLRSTGRYSAMHPIAREGAFWRLEFLADSGDQLQPEKDKMRARASAGLAVQISGLPEPVWKSAVQLPRDFRPKPWESLLLDAEAHLPDIVPALVLTAAALEILIENSLALVAPTDKTAAELWTFINNRGDYRKEPSVAEQWDQLLHTLTGHSLKEQKELWEAFRNIRDARNSLMHEGILSLGGHPVSKERAVSLIARAKEIADWIEGFLPANARRPPNHTMQIQLTRMLVANRSSDSNYILQQVKQSRLT